MCLQTINRLKSTGFSHYTFSSVCVIKQADTVGSSDYAVVRLFDFGVAIESDPTG